MDYSDLIPLVAIVFIFGAPIAAFIVSRVLAHQERMEMLRRGIVPPPNPREMRRAMKYGWTPSAPPPGPSGPYAYETDFYAQRQLRRGIQVAFIGFALLVGLGFIGYHGDGRYTYGPWLLGGLIPMFVGIAQIVGAVLSGATIGPASTRERFGSTPAGSSGPTPGGDPGATTPPGPTYGGWRPGGIPEIEKPASPPDYRT
jgi:MFS family permease